MKKLLLQQGFTSFYSDLLCHPKSDKKKINMNIIYDGPILSDAMRSQLDLSFSRRILRGLCGAYLMTKPLAWLAIIVITIKQLGLLLVMK